MVRLLKSAVRLAAYALSALHVSLLIYMITLSNLSYAADNLPVRFSGNWIWLGSDLNHPKICTLEYNDVPWTFLKINENKLEGWGILCQFTEIKTISEKPEHIRAFMECNSSEAVSQNIEYILIDNENTLLLKYETGELNGYRRCI